MRSRPSRKPPSGRRPTAAPGCAALVYAVVVVVAWLAIGGVGGPTVGRLSEVQQNDNTAFLPKSAESTTVSGLTAAFNPSTSLPYFVVIERPEGLTAADQASARRFIAGVPDLTFAVGGKALGPYLARPPAAAVPSADGKALLVPVELDADKADEVLGGSSVLFEGAAALRASAKRDAGTLRAERLRDRARWHARRLRHGVRRHRRHPARRRARRRLPDPADRLPQPDPALRRPAHRGVRARRGRARHLPAGQERHDRAERPEPGDPVDPRGRRGHRLRAAAGRPLPRGAARPPEQVGRDAAWPGGPRSSRSGPVRRPSSSGCCACCSPSWATPAGSARSARSASPARSSPRSPSCRRSCCCSAGGSSGPGSRAWTTCTPRTPWAAGALGAGGRHGRPAPAAHLGRHAARAAGRSAAFVPTLPGRRRHPVRAVPRQGRVRHRPGGPRPPLPGRRPAARSRSSSTRTGPTPSWPP